MSVSHTVAQMPSPDASLEKDLSMIDPDNKPENVITSLESSLSDGVEEYPKGAKLGLIILGLMLSMFLVKFIFSNTLI